MEKMNLFNNKRDNKVIITDVAINKLQHIKYPTVSEYDNELIYFICKKVLEYSKNENDSNEVAITVRLGADMKHDLEYGIAFGDEHNVHPLADPVTYHLLHCVENDMDETFLDCVMVMSHNHPSLSNLSLADISFFVEHDKLRLIIAVTNMGKIFYLCKGVNYKKRASIALLKEAVLLERHSKNLKEKQNAALYFLHKCYDVGLIYSYK